MEEFFTAIEEKIRQAGYTEPVNGSEIYHEICNELEEKESGTYIFMVKKTDSIYYEYNIDVFDEEFNLSKITIHHNNQQWVIEFD